MSNMSSNFIFTKITNPERGGRGSIFSFTSNHQNESLDSKSQFCAPELHLNAIPIADNQTSS